MYNTLTEMVTDVADAIREQEKTTALIPVAEYGDRIRAIEGGGGGGTGQIVRYPNFLTPQEEEQNGVLRCDGQAVYKAKHSALFELLKYDYPMYASEITGFPSGAHGNGYLAGNILFISITSNSTSIMAIDTTDDSLFEITGLPSRLHNVFEQIGNKLFIASTSSNQTAIVEINLTSLNVTQITGLPSRNYNSLASHGTMLYVGSNTMAATIVVIDTTDNSRRDITGIASRTYNPLFKAGTNIYIGNPNTTTVIPVINAINNTLSEITVSSNISRTSFSLVGNHVCIGSQTASTMLLFINITNNAFIERLGLPNLDYRLLASVGLKLIATTNSASNNTIIIIDTTDLFDPNNLTILTVPSRQYSTLYPVDEFIYCGSSTIFTTLVVINTTDNSWFEITGLPSRSHSNFEQFEHLLYVGTISTTATTFVVIDTILFTNFLIVIPFNFTRTQTTLVSSNDKVYSMSTQSFQTSITVITQAVTPTYIDPLYIKT